MMQNLIRLVLDLSNSNGIEYNWIDGSKNNIYDIGKEGYFGVEITAEGRCSLVYEDINVYWFDPDQLPEQEEPFCLGESIDFVLDTIFGIEGAS